MKSLKIFLLPLIIVILLTSCSNFSSLRSCPDAEIEWVDMVMIQDIKYQYHYPDTAEGDISFEIGRELGKVSYKMADNACSDHKMKNGDAAFIKEGTPIYEIKGYPTALVVAANDKVYIADENMNAKTVGELYPMNDLVKNIYIESIDDGSRIHTLTQPSKDKFLEAWYKLKLEDIQRLYKEGKMEGKRIFIDIELNNGVSFRQLYWADTNTFHNGAVGSPEIKAVINNELAN